MPTALWELDRATVVMPNLEKQYAYARQVLGNANRRPLICRRRFQSQAMTFLNQARSTPRRARPRGQGRGGDCFAEGAAGLFVRGGCVMAERDATSGFE